MNDYIMSEEGAEFDFSSTSLGCARACGYLCEALGDGVIKDKYKVLLKNMIFIFMIRKAFMEITIISWKQMK